MNEQALVPVLGPSEARRLTNEVKRDAETLWQKLVELYEAGAHAALNYPSWHEYCTAEFGFSRRHAYRLLEAGRVSERVTHGTLNERQARELAPLLRDEDEDAIVEVWHELRAEHGERLTAEKVRTAVEKKLAPKPATSQQSPTDAERSLGVTDVTEKQFMAAVVEMAQMLGWLVYHTHDSRSSEAGFPDIVCVRRDRVLFIELKTEKGRLSEAQERWLSALGLAGADVHCWRPSD